MTTTIPEPRRPLRLAALCTALAFPLLPQLAAAVKPNIILILTDDQDLLLGSLPYMSNLNAQVAQQGTTFSNYFVPLSLCCPSRTTMLRGQYTHNHGVLTNQSMVQGFDHFQDLNLDLDTLATRLQNGGYSTALAGKYLNGYPGSEQPTYVPLGWSEWYSPISGSPYAGIGYKLNENGVVSRKYDTLPADYLTDVLRARAVDFVRRKATANQPFFLYLAPYAPHKPATPAPRHSALFAGVKAPQPQSFNEPNVSDKPSHIRNLPLLTSGQISEINKLYRDRLRSLQAVDEMLLEIVTTLQNTNNQLANTYIFFTSDNGYHMGEHRLDSGKRQPYEEDVHVPLIVRGPGVPAGATATALASEVDLGATFLDLAGVAAPAFFDGRSLKPVWSGTATGWRQSVLIEHWADVPTFAASVVNPDIPVEPLDPSDSIPMPNFKGFRTATYKYVEYATGEKEFYDLVADPNEAQNRASSQTPAFLSAASSLLSQLFHCAGATCRSADAQTPPHP